MNEIDEEKKAKSNERDDNNNKNKEMKSDCFLLYTSIFSFILALMLVLRRHRRHTNCIRVYVIPFYFHLITSFLHFIFSSSSSFLICYVRLLSFRHSGFCPFVFFSFIFQIQFIVACICVWCDTVFCMFVCVG